MESSASTVSDIVSTLEARATKAEGKIAAAERAAAAAQSRAATIEKAASEAAVNTVTLMAATVTGDRGTTGESLSGVGALTLALAHVESVGSGGIGEIDGSDDMLGYIVDNSPDDADVPDLFLVTLGSGARYVAPLDSATLARLKSQLGRGAR